MLSALHGSVLRLAYANPNLRKHLLPLIKTASPPMVLDGPDWEGVAADLPAGTRFTIGRSTPGIALGSGFAYVLSNKFHIVMFDMGRRRSVILDPRAHRLLGTL